MPIDLDHEAQKAIIKEAITEWLDAKFSEFGKWSFFGIVAMFFAWLVYQYMTSAGFGK